MKLFEAVVESIHSLCEGVFSLSLAAPGISRHVSPGQFYMVRVGEGSDPLLWRPFAYHGRGRCGTQDGLEILFRVVGRGTRMLSQKRKGEVLRVMGPLGKGWDPRGPGIPVLVVGGMGVASLYPLAEYLARRSSQGWVFLGARRPEELFFLGKWEEMGFRVLTAVEEGGHSFRGTVMDLLEDRWDSLGLRDPRIFGCGPGGLVRRLALWSLKRGVPCQVSLEVAMGCGMGVCLGCAIKAVGLGYLHACRDGPVFQANEIDWSVFHEG